MDFTFYLKQGVEHILDLNGYDHMLFVVTLCAVYQLKAWKKVLVLLTAFTIGHSITLALAGLGVLKLPQDLIETLIPITICLTALSNILFYKRIASSKHNYNYWVALLFGFVHGAGFSNFFRSLFMGMDENLVVPLLGFNCGIELGQIVIVLVFFGVYYLLNLLGNIKHQRWSNFISATGFIVALLIVLGVL